MNPEAYVEMAATESTHWWFRARRRILDRIIDSLALPHAARILEAGSGTGGNLSMLSRHGSVSAFEMDDSARELAAEKAAGRFILRAGSCPHDIPFPGEQFDLICMFDVLEHIDEDVLTLAALRTHLAVGGRVLVTVPAYPWLWGVHDEFLHHKRRYTSRGLRQALAAGGLAVDRITHFNMLLLPLAILARLKDHLMPIKRSSGTAVPPAPVNAALGAILSSERHLLATLNLPAGVSLLAIAHAA